MTKLQEKLYYTTIGFLLTFINLFLIETRFNIVGMGFGFVSIYFFIRALLIRPEKK